MKSIYAVLSRSFRKYESRILPQTIAKAVGKWSNTTTPKLLSAKHHTAALKGERFDILHLTVDMTALLDVDDSVVICQLDEVERERELLTCIKSQYNVVRDDLSPIISIQPAGLYTLTYIEAADLRAALEVK